MYNIANITLFILEEQDMTATEIFERIKPWLKPALTILLGLILVFRPDSITAAVGGIIGYAISLAGSAMMVTFFFSQNRKFSTLLIGIVLLVLGFSVVRNPLSLASHLGQLAGLLLLLQGIRSYSRDAITKRKAVSIVLCILGGILLLLPLTASRLVFTGAGIVVLVIGGGMLLEQARARMYLPSHDDIIDAG